jgi:hypothetical protein
MVASHPDLICGSQLAMPCVHQFAAADGDARLA